MQEEILANSNPLKDWKLAIDLNAKLLDALYRLSFHKMHKDDIDFLITQIEKTPNYIVVYSKRIKAKVGDNEKRFLDE